MGDSAAQLIDVGGAGCRALLCKLHDEGRMSTESQLREKLRKIEALFAGAGTTGERLAARRADYCGRRLWFCELSHRIIRMFRAKLTFVLDK